MAGQPTKYKEKYCQMLIDHMRQGYSYRTFAAIVEVNPDTLYNWEKLNPTFSDAKKRAFAHCQYFWETAGLEGMEKSTKYFNAGVWIFNMKNRFDWGDNNKEGAGDQFDDMVYIINETNSK